MTIEAQIDAAIALGKTNSISWAYKFLLKSNNGEEIGSHENKLILLTSWINILEDYKTENFGDNGSITADYPCLDLDQVQLLISKINSIEEC